MRTALLAVVLLVLLPVASAEAAARTQSAQAFADVLLRARVAIKAQAPDLERRYEEAEPDCEDLFDSAPDRLAVEMFKLSFGATIQPYADLIIESSRQIVAGLDAVPTRDPVLRSGRAAWRAALRLNESHPRVDDACADLARWRDAGWGDEAMPPYLHDEDDADSGPTIERKMHAASRRLRMLGISPRVAGFFTGDGLLDGVPFPLG